MRNGVAARWPWHGTPPTVIAMAHHANPTLTPRTGLVSRLGGYRLSGRVTPGAYRAQPLSESEASVHAAVAELSERADEKEHGWAERSSAT